MITDTFTDPHDTDTIRSELKFDAKTNFFITDSALFQAETETEKDTTPGS